MTAWYTLEQIHQHFGIRESKTRYAIKCGRLKTIKVTPSRGDGFKYLVEESSIREWMRNPTKRGRRKLNPGPIISEHYIREEKPLVINKEFTSVEELLKEGETMTVGEIKDRIDNAVVESEVFGDGWVSVEEAAMLSGKEKSTIKRAIKNGTLKASKYHCNPPGKYDFKWMIRIEDIDPWASALRKRTKKKKKPEVVAPPVVSNDEKDSTFNKALETLKTSFYTALDVTRKDGHYIGYTEGYDAGYTEGYNAARKEYENKIRDIRNILGEDAE